MVPEELIEAEEEVEVLRSMYDADFEDIRKKDTWKVGRKGQQNSGVDLKWSGGRPNHENFPTRQ